jgi:thiol-disulfide isomerase/thioredoxin
MKTQITCSETTISKCFTQQVPCISQKYNTTVADRQSLWAKLKVRITMERIILILLSIATLSSFKSIDPTIDIAISKLSCEKALIYNVNELTIEGKLSGDTIFTSKTCTFEKLVSDSLFGFKYFIESNLIHPRFKIPMTTRNYYNGENHFWNLDSEVKKDRVITKKSELVLSKLEIDTYGQIPIIIKILNLNGFVFRSKKDTTIQNIPCIQISTVSLKNIPYDLFIDKKTKYPKLLRIVENQEQPFIREYYYSDFNSISSLDEPLFVSQSVIKTIDGEILKIGDIIPNWKLQTIDGRPFSMEENKGKTTILFLSAIYCGWCQKAIPTINRIYNKYMKDNTLNCLAFYPDDTKDKLIGYIKSKEIDYQVIFNPKSDKIERYKLRDKIRYGYPTTIILNNKNEIIWIKTGFYEDMEKEIEKEINSLHNK